VREKSLFVLIIGGGGVFKNSRDNLSAPRVSFFVYMAISHLLKTKLLSVKTIYRMKEIVTGL